MTSNYIYYVYAYINKKTLLPYYIGKGKGNRAFVKHIGISIPNDKTKIIFLEKNLSELGALALERRYIRWYGRKDSGTGILLNKTDGGDTPPTKYGIDNPSFKRKGTTLPEEWKNKIANSIRKRKYKHNSETRLLISKRLSGRLLSEEHRDNISKSLTGRIPWNKGMKGLQGSPGKRSIASCCLCRREIAVNNMNRHLKFSHSSS